jgi:hypothetical protein
MRCGIQGPCALGVPVQTPLAGDSAAPSAEDTHMAKGACTDMPRTKLKFPTCAPAIHSEPTI